MSKHLLILAVAGIVTLGTAGCSSDNVQEPITPTYKTGLKASERSSEEFGKVFPQQYKSYLKNNETGLDTETTFKASFHFRKNDDTNKPPVGKPGAAQPYLKNLWEGYPFSYEYNEARGHTYAVEDILRIDRINNYSDKAGLPATCWNCKVPNIPDWVAQYGDDKFWSMNFHDFRTTDKVDMKNNSIGCANCHNPESMELTITSIPLKAALERKGVKDLSTLSRNDKRALVCGQCHVEYYFSEPDHGPNKKPVFPWDVNTAPVKEGSTFQKIWGNGLDPEQIYTYDMDKGPKKADGTFDSFADWTHPVSQTRMIKAQHPEFET